MSTSVFVDPESSTQADRAQSSRVPVPLLKDPYEVIRQAYLVGTNTESKPFECKARKPESPHIVAPPTCHIEESEGSGTSGVRSTSSNSTALLSPDYPVTHTTPALVPTLCRTARMAMRVPPAMLPGLFAGIVEVAAMSDSAFRKRFRSSYDSSPSPTLPVWKRYRGTSELILGTDSEEVEESSNSDSESEGTEDEGPTIEDEDLAGGDEGLTAGIEGPGVDDESYGLDDESYGLDDKSYGLDDESYGVDDESYGVDDESYGLDDESYGVDDESYGLDDESHSVDDESHGLDDEGRDVEIDRLGLEEEEAVHKGHQQATLVVETAVSAPLGLGYGVLRRRELALEGDHVYNTFKAEQGSGSALEPER
nr:hypothetical protein [Tanacetum cinerariifolium]